MSAPSNSNNGLSKPPEPPEVLRAAMEKVLAENDRREAEEARKWEELQREWAKTHNVPLSPTYEIED